MTKQKTTTKQIPVEKESKEMIDKWSNAITKEGIEKLKHFINNTKNEGLRSYAELSLDETYCFYYGGDNEKEHKDFMLAKMILYAEDRIIDLMCKKDAAKFELEKLDLDEKVHQKVMKNAKNELWQYNFSKDFRAMVKGRLEEFEDQIAYQEAWIAAARKSITIPKYKDVPDDFLRHTHFDGEGFSIWDDEE